MKKGISAIHTLNTFDYMLYKMLNFNNVVYIPWGVDLTFLESCKSKSKNDKFTVIFLGARYQKGADFALKIFQHLQSRVDFQVIIITGHGSLREMVNKFYKFSGSYRNVRIIDWLPRAEFLKLLSQSHALLFPSRTETFGLVVLEALGMGTPVIAFDIPGAPHDILKLEINKGNLVGYTSSPFDIWNLAKGLILFYSIWRADPEAYTEISRKCISVASRYPISHMAKSLVSLFKECII